MKRATTIAILLYFTLATPSLSAPAFSWQVGMTTDWTEFNRRSVGIHTLWSSAYVLRIDASTCSLPHLGSRLRDCVYFIPTLDLNYLYRYRACNAAGCGAWFEGDRVWCAGPGVGCPPFFASEP